MRAVCHKSSSLPLCFPQSVLENAKLYATSESSPELENNCFSLHSHVAPLIRFRSLQLLLLTKTCEGGEEAGAEGSCTPLCPVFVTTTV